MKVDIVAAATTETCDNYGLLAVFARRNLIRRDHCVC